MNRGLRPAGGAIQRRGPAPNRRVTGDNGPVTRKDQIRNGPVFTSPARTQCVSTAAVVNELVEAAEDKQLSRVI